MRSRILAALGRRRALPYRRARDRADRPRRHGDGGRFRGAARRAARRPAGSRSPAVATRARPPAWGSAPGGRGRVHHAMADATAAMQLALLLIDGNGDSAGGADADVAARAWARAPGSGARHGSAPPTRRSGRWTRCMTASTPPAARTRARDHGEQVVTSLAPRRCSPAPTERRAGRARAPWEGHDGQSAAHVATAADR